MKKFLKDNWILILSLIYILSPIDIIPEAFLGPFGIIDDSLLVILLLTKGILEYLHNRKINSLNEIPPED